MTVSQTPHLAFSEIVVSKPDQVFMMAPACAELPWAPEGFSITYGDAAVRVETLSKAFSDAGYGRGSRVGLLLENRPDFVLYWLALNAIGASIAPLNGDMRPAELEHQLTTAACETIISVPQFKSLLEQLSIEGLNIAMLGEPIPDARTKMAPDGGHPEDEAALLFTSGSSGKPKACILSNDYFMRVADWYATLQGVAKMRKFHEVSLTPLPFFHMNALGCTVVGMMRLGGTIVPLDRFHPASWWQTIAESHATIVHSLGVIPAILLKRPEGPFDRGHSARFTFGPGVEEEHKHQFEARFGLPIIEAWAMTETGGIGVIDTSGLDTIPAGRCVGVAHPEMEWQLVDDEGQPVSQGEAGELLVRASGPDPRQGFFSGYLGDKAATEKAWEGGWFHTGDVFRIDESGYFFFLDRRKSIVRRSGENISALEVEAAIAVDSTVSAVAVTPVPDPLREEEVFAFIVPDKGTADAEQLLRRVATRLSYHKLPGFVQFCDALPVSSTQKVQRGQIKADAEAALAAGTSIDLRSLKAKIRKELAE